MDMMNILISIICGFVGGLLGAMIIAESRSDDSKKKIQSLIDGHLSIRSDIDKEKERISLIDHALRVLAVEQKKDRGQIWESLNALWNDYDQRHAVSQESQESQKQTQTQKTEKPKAKPKAKKESDKNA